MPSSSSPLLSQQAYDALYDSLTSSRLHPGDEINRRQMAAELGMSVGPVVEAMLQLEWEGFLEARPRRGTKVRVVTARQMLGWVQVRIAIEAQAARISAGPKIESAFDRMLAMAKKLDAEPRGTPESARLEVAFHRALVDVADDPVISRMFERVMRHSFYYWAKRLLPQFPGCHKQAHVRLIGGLASATPQKADRLIRSHLEPWIEVLTPAATEDAAASPRATGRLASRDCRPARRPTPRRASPSVSRAIRLAPIHPPEPPACPAQRSSPATGR